MFCVKDGWGVSDKTNCYQISLAEPRKHQMGVELVISSNFPTKFILKTYFQPNFKIAKMASAQSAVSLFIKRSIQLLGLLFSIVGNVIINSLFTRLY